MSKLSKIGIKGEQIAKDFLQNKGYIILFTNWRYGKKEVDLVAAIGDLAIIVEVKTRSASRLSYPEEAVTNAKRNHLLQAGAAFLDTFHKYRNVRYDIISILFDGEAAREIVHFEQAF